MRAQEKQLLWVTRNLKGVGVGDHSFNFLQPYHLSPSSQASGPSTSHVCLGKGAELGESTLGSESSSLKPTFVTQLAVRVWASLLTSLGLMVLKFKDVFELFQEWQAPKPGSSREREVKPQQLLLLG